MTDDPNNIDDLGEDDPEGKLPVAPEPEDLQLEDAAPAPDPGQEALDIQEELDSLEPPEDEGSIQPVDLADNQPQPVDKPPPVPGVKGVTISDVSPVGFKDEFGGTDLSSDVATDRDESAPPPELADVDAATRDFDQMADDIEAFHAGTGIRGMLNEADPIAHAGGDNQDEIPQALDADLHNRDTMTGFLVEHTRKIQELTLRLERERL